MIELNMPRLSDSMEEGVIVRWLFETGASVTAGAELAEIETDKAILPLEAVANGRLHITAQEGSTLPVGSTIGWLLAENETAPTAPSITTASLETGTDGASTEAVRTTRQTKDGLVPAPTMNSSPIARRMAVQFGVDLALVTGTGPNGRIMKADVVNARTRVSKTAEPAAQSTGRGDVQRIQLTRLQRTVATRMTESKATTPEFTLTTDVDMEQAVELRARLKLILEPAPSLNDLVIKALALALRQHPELNASYNSDGTVDRFSRINIGVAVAGAGTLLVPTVFDADRASLAAIAAATRRLAERARAGQLTPDEMANSTATVSNLGMFGISQFVGILNPPEAMILAVGAVEHRAVATADGVVSRHGMSATATFDHRVVYGADGAQLLATFRELLEQPLKLLL